MDDVRITDPAVLCAAVLQDTSRPELATTPDIAERIVGTGTADVLRELPSPDRDPQNVVEELLAARPGVLALYLAARLDDARHMHLGDSRRWRAVHAQVEDTLIPLAHRCHPLLARRFERWAGAFRRRFLGQADAERPAEPSD